MSTSFLGQEPGEEIHQIITEADEEADMNDPQSQAEESEEADSPQLLLQVIHQVPSVHKFGTSLPARMQLIILRHGTGSVMLQFTVLGNPSGPTLLMSNAGKYKTH